MKTKRFFVPVQRVKASHRGAFTQLLFGGFNVNGYVEKHQFIPLIKRDTMLQELSPEMSVFALLGSEGNVYFVCLFVCHTEHFKSVPCSDITTKHHRAHRSFLRGCDWGQVRPRPQIHVQKHTTFVCRTAVFQSPMKTSVDLLRRSIFPAAACSYRAPFLTNTVIHEIQRNVTPLFLSVFP